MKSYWEDLKKNSEGILHVTIDGKEWNNAQNSAKEKLFKNLEIKGFRKGHVPENIAIKHINSKDIFSNAVNRIANIAFMYGIKKNNLKPIIKPTLDIKSMTKDSITLSFKLVVKPKVILCNYKNINLNFNKNKKITVTDNEINNEIKKIQKENFELCIKKDNIVSNNDIVNIDFVGTLENGDIFEGNKAKNFSIEIGSNSFIPGFEKKIIGMKKNEKRNIKLKFPKNYQLEKLRNKNVIFKIKINEIKIKKIPALNKNFFKKLKWKKIKNFNDFKNKLIKDIIFRKKNEEKIKIESKLLKYITDNSKVKIPKIMIKNETKKIFENYKNRFEQQKNMSFDNYLKAIGKKESDFFDNLILDTKKKIKTYLVIEKIIEIEKLKTNKNEIIREFILLSNMYNIDYKKIRTFFSEDQVIHNILFKKAIKKIKAKIINKK